MITDLRMPDVDGLAVVDAARHASAVIVMTAFGEIASAVEAMRRGAWHYVSKPVRLAELVQHARRALAERGGAATTQIVGTSAAMQEVTAAAVRVARADVPVLDPRRDRHRQGAGRARDPRRERPRDRPVRRDQLRRDARGARSRASCSATRAARSPAPSPIGAGVFGAADGGTLFLDEIGDMPLALQAKLLRVLQEREVRAVGADQAHAVDVRVDRRRRTGTSSSSVRDGRFRSDLCYRLDVVPIRVPPLRERRDDIPLLAQHFLARARARGIATRVERLARRR